MKEGEESILQVLVDDAIVVEVVDNIEDGADGGDHIVFGKLTLCEDVVNARLKVLVKLDLKKPAKKRGEHSEIQTMLRWSKQVRSVSVQMLASL